MVLTIRAILLFLAIALGIALFGAGVASAQGANAQLIVTTRSADGSVVPPSATVTVGGAGPSLTGVPGSTGTLTYSTNWNSDTKVVTMVPSTYSVSVAGLSGYTYSYSSECSGTMSSGQTRTCTVTASTASLPRVIVYTQVLNNQGGNRLPTEFSFNVSGNNPSPAFFYGSAAGMTVTLNPGSYSIQDATAFSGYDTFRSEGCSGVIGSGETRTCTITKDDRAFVSPYPSTLQCHPPRQAARIGYPVTFTATGGSATYNWATADRTFLNAGPTLNTVLQSAGSQTVIVTSGFETASCVVDVVGGSVIFPGKVLGTTTVPYLPNTGFGPSALGTIASVIAMFGLAIPLALYGRKTFAFIWR